MEYAAVTKWIQATVAQSFAAHSDQVRKMTQPSLTTHDDFVKTAMENRIDISRPVAAICKEIEKSPSLSSDRILRQYALEWRGYKMMLWQDNLALWRSKGQNADQLFEEVVDSFTESELTQNTAWISGKCVKHEADFPLLIPGAYRKLETVIAGGSRQFAHKYGDQADDDGDTKMVLVNPPQRSLKRKADDFNTLIREPLPKIARLESLNRLRDWHNEIDTTLASASTSSSGSGAYSNQIEKKAKAQSSGDSTVECAQKDAVAFFTSIVRAKRKRAETEALAAWFNPVWTGVVKTMLAIIQDAENTLSSRPNLFVRIDWEHALESMLSTQRDAWRDLIRKDGLTFGELQEYIDETESQMSAFLNDKQLNLSTLEDVISKTDMKTAEVKDMCSLLTLRWSMATEQAVSRLADCVLSSTRKQRYLERIFNTNFARIRAFAESDTRSSNSNSRSTASARTFAEMQTRAFDSSTTVPVAGSHDGDYKGTNVSMTTPHGVLAESLAQKTRLLQQSTFKLDQLRKLGIAAGNGGLTARNPEDAKRRDDLYATAVQADFVQYVQTVLAMARDIMEPGRKESKRSTSGLDLNTEASVATTAGEEQAQSAVPDSAKREGLKPDSKSEIPALSREALLTLFNVRFARFAASPSSDPATHFVSHVLKREHELSEKIYSGMSLTGSGLAGQLQLCANQIQSTTDEIECALKCLQQLTSEIESSTPLQSDALWFHVPVSQAQTTKIAVIARELIHAFELTMYGSEHGLQQFTGKVSLHTGGATPPSMWKVADSAKRIADNLYARRDVLSSATHWQLGPLLALLCDVVQMNEFTLLLRVEFFD